MRRWITSKACAASVMTLIACSSADESADSPHAEGALGAAVDTTHFSMDPGVERVRQHKGPVDVAQNQKQSIDLKNVYWLGRLSDLAYKPAAEIRQGLSQMGLPSDDDHFRYFENGCTDSQAFYVSTASLSAPPAEIDNPWNKTSPDVAVLAFRGTEESNWNDIKTDLYAWNRPGAARIGSVHAGFHGALMSLWNAPSDPSCGSFEAIGAFLRAHHQFDARGAKNIRRGAELYFTGHSLGASIATLALTKTATEQCEKENKWSDEDCFREYTPVSALVTFGSPRVGDQSYANTSARWMQDRTPIFRFVHGRDAVTSIPSSFGWYHPGFDGDENTFKVLVADDPLRMYVSADGDRGKGSLIEDHRMVHYMETLTKMATSGFVP